ncbi:hypothetical protein LEP1GSC170_3660 [Leptospira interrogans serovar Bataviae str. HAI135]|nr:hypothetical protein LEP1GSC170_3660 [Leptospira interrogans serovar Bataviae str. HAI135]
MHTTIFVGTPANHDFTNMSGNVGTPTYKKISFYYVELTLLF